MEAASARWAEREGPGYSISGSSMTGKKEYTRLEGLIRYACESPNINPHQRFSAENMDAQAAVCDEINAKKSNAAHFAADLIVRRYINGIRADCAFKALQLLDSCVKNCGDPFHYAISTKEWLNELVRRFGPTPPPKNRVQEGILRLLELWYRTIAQTSFIKDDLAYIRDMHRLLLDKGFSFPRPDPDDINALSGLEVKGVQTEEAIKERRNEALHAKLQDLLRRGGMKNLQEANRIMKVLSDFDQSDKTDIRQEAADRISDVRERTKLLSERLRAFKPGDQMNPGDAFASLVDELKAEQHKLHNTLQNDRESEDSMKVLLGINEEINHVVEWYDALKAGNFDEAKRLENGGPAKGTTAGGQSSSTGAADLSLIDFDESQAPAAAPGSQEALQDDLLGLSLGDTGAQGSITLGPSISPVPAYTGFSTPQETQPVSNSQTNSTILAQFQQPTLVSPASSKPNYAAFNNTFSAQTSSSSTPAPSLNQQAKQLSATQTQNAVPAAPSDPFAMLASTSRSTSAQAPAAQASVPSSIAQNSLLDLGEPTTAPVPTHVPVATNVDDDWDFSGAPPPEEEDLVVFNGDVKIEFQVSRASDTSLSVTAVFSNNTSEPISKLDFRSGMPKTYPRRIDPISSTRLQPQQHHGAYQRFTIEGVAKGQAPHIPRIKWRLSRVVREGTEPKLDQGEAPSFSLN